MQLTLFWRGSWFVASLEYQIWELQFLFLLLILFIHIYSLFPFIDDGSLLLTLHRNTPFSRLIPLFCNYLNNLCILLFFTIFFNYFLSFSHLKRKTNALQRQRQHRNKISFNFFSKKNRQKSWMCFVECGWLQKILMTSNFRCQRKLKQCMKNSFMKNYTFLLNLTHILNIHFWVFVNYIALQMFL